MSTTSTYVTPGIVIPGARTLGRGFGTYWATKSGAGRIPSLLFVFAFVLLGAAPIETVQNLAAEISIPVLGLVLGVAGIFIPVLVNWLLSKTRLGVLGALLTTLTGLYLVTGASPLDDAAILNASAAFAGLYLLGVVLHEAAHAVVGVKTGLHLRGMALAPWGAACSFAEDEMTELPTWRSMLWTTVAGPLTSLAFGTTLLGAASVTEGPIATTLRGVAMLNLALGALNLLPVLPMDGGFVAAALRWRRHPEWSCTEATESVRPWGKMVFPAIGAISVLVAVLNPNPTTIIFAVQLSTLVPLMKWASKAIAGDNAALKELRKQEREIEQLSA
jgi:Zn-dependent protease